MSRFELGTPVNTALFLFILYSVQRIIYPKVDTPAEGADVPNEFKKGMLAFFVLNLTFPTSSTFINSFPPFLFRRSAPPAPIMAH
jgi:hypothetical protein